ncbi:hypothetical protein [Actinoplanes couchii]|uniref:Uncharacterized protein n=1 Tax=Actinoplanes couchii TaxID=403638 RepID=A0ABQ3XS70_9ACTN|nr:hypothetical protein [Actinoplanes couchii]MDR6317952.1 hypothetical protein [Actinoplanes couchii]GID61362.1 hypothetical protein Aco03nite_097660 [Actinoplanes couchii]
MLLATDSPRTLGSEQGSRLSFSRPENQARRVLTVDEAPAFELSFWCGTCQFLFERLEGATTTFSGSPDHPTVQPGPGLDEAAISRFGELLPRASYQPLLLQVNPRLIHPAKPGDYFAEEQVATWGVDSFWGLPTYPRTQYYRTFETRVSSDAHLYEFVVPMVPPSWNDRARVDAYAADLAAGAPGTAVAVSLLDVCAPAVDQGSDYYTHWALVHFLLDGHHRMQAAAETGRPLRLLSLLSLEAGLAAASQTAELPTIRAAAARQRPTPTTPDS